MIFVIKILFQIHVKLRLSKFSFKFNPNWVWVKKIEAKPNPNIKMIVHIYQNIELGLSCVRSTSPSCTYKKIIVNSNSMF